MQRQRESQALFQEPPSAKLLEMKPEDLSPADMFYYT